MLHPTLDPAIKRRDSVVDTWLDEAPAPTAVEKRLPLGCDEQGRHPEVSDQENATGWLPFTMLETLKFWAAVFGPALLVILVWALS